ncbi:MAG: LysR family transcriptional regulator [Myxococcota bacterium]|nr:LysR family transcriptional regulator [Myxococcota bacterium]
MPLNYNHLYYFHVAAVEGSVASAAQRLGVRQPTVSEQLRSLERSLGFDLFERLQSGLRLTERGRLVFEHSSRMFEIGERLIDMVGPGSQGVSRMLRIGVSGAIARSTTSDFLLPVCALENCIPSVWTGDTVELLRELRAGMVDLVLCETEPPNALRRGLQVTLIEHTPLVAAAPIDLAPSEDWSDVGLAHYRPTSPYRWEVEAFLEARGLTPRIVVESDDSIFLIEVAIRNRCIAIVPRTAARDALAAGRLRALEEVSSTNVAVHALYQDTVAADLTRRAVEVLLRAAARPMTDAP